MRRNQADYDTEVCSEEEIPDTNVRSVGITVGENNTIYMRIVPEIPGIPVLTWDGTNHHALSEALKLYPHMTVILDASHVITIESGIFGLLCNHVAGGTTIYLTNPSDNVRNYYWFSLQMKDSGDNQTFKLCLETNEIDEEKNPYLAAIVASQNKRVKNDIQKALKKKVRQ